MDRALRGLSQGLRSAVLIYVCQAISDAEWIKPAPHSCAPRVPGVTLGHTSTRLWRQRPTQTPLFCQRAPIRHQHGSRRSCSVPLQFCGHSRDQQPPSATARRSERRQPSARRISTIFLMQSQLNSVNCQCVVARSVCASDSRLGSYIGCFHIAKRHDRGQR